MGARTEAAGTDRRRRVHVFLAAAVAIGVVGSLAGGARPVSAGGGIDAAADPSIDERLSPRLGAISPGFGSVLTQTTATDLPVGGVGSLLRDGSGRLLVDVTLDAGAALDADVIEQIRGEIVATGFDGRMATVAIPTYRLRDLAAIDGVAYVTEGLAPLTSSDRAPRIGARPGRPLAASGSTCGTGILSEGDGQLNADDARTDFDVDGSGIVVGVLSDSYDHLDDASGDVAASELPGPGNPCGRTTAVGVVADHAGSDEGRAMAQIIHDLAPGAELRFATAFESEIGFANRILELGEGGADIITDDVAYLYEPLFQEGYIASAIRQNRLERGIPHFTSAGNSNVIVGGRNVSSYEAPAFRPASCPAEVPSAYTACHDFDPGVGVDIGNGITLAAGGSLLTGLGWSEPQFGVATDLDLLLVDESNDAIVAMAALNSIANGRPNEVLSYTNHTGSTGSYRLMIARHGNGGAPRLKYLHYRSSGIVAVERDTSAGGDTVGPTIAGHSASTHAVSVAAVPYFNSSQPESFSSRGPGHVCWQPVDGSTPQAAVAPCTSAQVDIAATDGGANSFFGSWSGSAWRFYGTSAAAPHAAAVAALTAERARCATTDQLLDALIDSAAPVGAHGADAVGARPGRCACGHPRDRHDGARALPDRDGRRDRRCGRRRDRSDRHRRLRRRRWGRRTGDHGDLRRPGRRRRSPDHDRRHRVGPPHRGRRRRCRDRIDHGDRHRSGRSHRLDDVHGRGDRHGAGEFVRRDGRRRGRRRSRAPPRHRSRPPPPSASSTPDSAARPLDGRFVADGPIASDTVYEVQIGGRGDIPSDATAAVLNLSTVDSAGPGFLTIYPCGQRPLASALNYTGDGVMNNEIVAQLSETGTACIYARTTTHLIVDATGTATTESPYTPLTPARLADTRASGGTVDGAHAAVGSIAGETVLEVQIGDRGNIAGDARAAALNVSVADAAGNGFLTIYDCGARPLASSINYGPGRVVNNEIITKLSPTGSICIYARTTTHVIIDAAGFVPAGTDYTPHTPARLVDTRENGSTTDGRFEGDGAVAGDAVYEVQIAGRGGVPGDAEAAVINLSVVGATGKRLPHDLRLRRPTARLRNQLCVRLRRQQRDHRQAVAGGNDLHLRPHHHASHRRRRRLPLRRRALRWMAVERLT